MWEIHIASDLDRPYPFRRFCFSLTTLVTLELLLLNWDDQVQVVIQFRAQHTGWSIQRPCIDESSAAGRPAQLRTRVEGIRRPVDRPDLERALTSIAPHGLA